VLRDSAAFAGQNSAEAHQDRAAAIAARNQRRLSAGPRSQQDYRARSDPRHRRSYHFDRLLHRAWRMRPIGKMHRPRTAAQGPRGDSEPAEYHHHIGHVQKRARGDALKDFMKTPIYFDNHAPTPMDPRVLEAMLPYFTQKFGNAASRNHAFGWESEKAVDRARKQIADVIGANPKEIVFTSGATESDNLAIKGVAEMYAEKGNHIIAPATEHKAVLDTCKKLEKHGCRITYLPLKSNGLVDLDQLRDSITGKTILVTVMYANNEIGVIQPVAEIGKICHERGVLFHTDGVQAFGKVPVDVNRDNIDLMSITAHKIYGPKGVGALYVRRRNPRVQLTAQMDGGGHERGMRSGTLNVPGIVGLGEACALCKAEMAEESKRMAYLRDKLKDRLLASLDE